MKPGNAIELPEEFIHQLTQVIGDEVPDFLRAIESPRPLSIRPNLLKLKPWKENFEPVKWYTKGIYLEQRPVFTLDPLFHGGAYYVQEASSMFVAEAVRQLVPTTRPLRVLDLAAAPGGKSTLLASVLSDESFLLANEVIRSRYKVLRENLIRWGHPGTHTSNLDPRNFSNLSGFFDLVLIDAPCSGEGLFRKDPRAIKEWSALGVQHCAVRQQRILSDALGLVRSGGILMYCTCTYNSLENEHNATWISEHSSFRPVDLNIPSDWNIESREIGYQFYPHRVKGEGFYLACFQQMEEESRGIQNKKLNSFQQLIPLAKKQEALLHKWLDQPEQVKLFQKSSGDILAILESQIMDCKTVSHHLPRLDLGVILGTFKGDDFIPAHDLALSNLVSKHLPKVDLDLDQALCFLKKEIPDLPKLPQGWVLANYKGINLGWLKVLKKRINNYFPKGWRIRMNIKR